MNYSMKSTPCPCGKRPLCAEGWCSHCDKHRKECPQYNKPTEVAK